jgi:hypothetical protein
MPNATPIFSPISLLTLQLLASTALVAAVLWFMWRLPRKDAAAYAGWTPWLAIGSAWAGLFAVVSAGLLWVLPYPDRWLPWILLLLCPAAVGAAVLVFWVYRGQTTSGPAAMHRTQARFGLTLGLLAVLITYAFVLTHKALFTPVGA